MKFRVELWRIAKFLLITAAVNLVFSLLYNAVSMAVVQGDFSRLSEGSLLQLLSYAHTFFSSLVLALLHRYFTFRATEKWYIAVPIMVIAAFGWNWLSALPRAASVQLGVNAAMNMISILGAAWFVLSYLLQRCAIYAHTIDTNGWYARFHPTNDEKGE